MMNFKKSYRYYSLLFLTLMIGALLTLIACATPTPETVIKEVKVEVIVTKEVIKEVEAKAAYLATTGKQVPNYKYTGSAPTSFSEAPSLTALANAGKIAPLQDRLPSEPLVVVPPDRIGKYGGTLRFGFLGAGDPDAILETNFDSPVKLSRDGKEIEPNLAKSWSVSADGKSWTWNLRKGMKWSDGTAYTSDDWIFAWEDLTNNPAFSGGPSGDFKVNGEKATLVKINDTSFKYSWPTPYHGFAWQLTGFGAAGTYVWGFNYAPKHYFSKMHPKYTSADVVAQQVKDAGVEDWAKLIRLKAFWWQNNPEVPVIGPFKGITTAHNEVWRMTRNPYYWVVDPEGNQLPYIDSWNGQASQSKELLNLAAMGGQLDFQYRHVDINKLPLFKASAERGNYRLILWPRPGGNEGNIYVNQTYDADPEIAKYLTNLDFRKALSYAIDRSEIATAIWHGTGVGRNFLPFPDHPMYPGAEYETKFATYDVAKANSLLDGIGMTKKDSNGIRLRGDGKPLEITLFISPGAHVSYEGLGSLLEGYWSKVGIKTLLKVGKRPKPANLFQLYIWEAGHTGDPWLSPHFAFPFWTGTFQGPKVGEWYQSGGKDGVDPNSRPELKGHARILELFDAGKLAKTEERVKMGQEVFRTIVDNQIAIGTIGMGPAFNGVGIVRNNLINVPETYAFIGAIRPALFSFE